MIMSVIYPVILCQFISSHVTTIAVDKTTAAMRLIIFSFFFFILTAYSNKALRKTAFCIKMIYVKLCGLERTMYIVVGLGNPGKDYDKTRHNAGFEVIDKLADEYNISMDIKKHKGICGKGVIEGQRVVLVKPQTYMNLSGECVAEVMNFYKADIEDLIVIFDDISLEPGKIRLRPKGSAGGHNGIKNIIAHTGTQDFWRIKVGVGDKPKQYDLVDWVLGHFSKEEWSAFEDGRDKACKALVCMMNEGIEAGMNKFN